MQCKHPDCSEEVVQTGKGRPKLFHSKECAHDFNRRQASEKASKGIRVHDHVLSGVDPERRLATCSQCGPLSPIYKSGGKDKVRWRCKNRVVGQESRSRPPRNIIRARASKARQRGIAINEEALLYLLARADGKCEYCGGRPKVLVIDHDHDSHRLRGLLCPHCNLWLGKLGDNRAGVLRVLAYIERYQ